MNIESEKKIWKEQNEPLGIKLGYPPCCIKEFCELTPGMMMKMKPSKIDRRKLKAATLNGNFTGFIPCADHAKQITMGKITLESLISNRDNSFLPFPLEGQF